MKTLPVFITTLLVITLSIFLGCKKEPQPEPTPDPTPVSGQALFWVASDFGCGNITVTCNNVSKDITTFSSNTVPACGASGTATFDFAPGTYTYTAACSGKTWSGEVTITEGACSKTQLTVGVVNTGQAMFWAASDLGCGVITVNCNNVTRTISSYYSSGIPACGASGNATFDLAPGTYAYSAECTGKTWNGTVTVTANGCNKIKLIDGAPSTGKATFWVASDLGCGSITVNCNGINRTITSFYGSAPTCGASGTATFDFSPGTYSYSAQCSGKTWSGTVTITASGCSKIELKGGAAATGQALFWTKSDLGCGNINVTCNGVTRTISSYYSSGAPACGANGCATFTLNPGTYSFSGKCSNKVWNGTITVTANGCSKLQMTN